MDGTQTDENKKNEDKNEATNWPSPWDASITTKDLIINNSNEVSENDRPSPFTYLFTNDGIAIVPSVQSDCKEIGFTINQREIDCWKTWNVDAKIEPRQVRTDYWRLKLCSNPPCALYMHASTPIWILRYALSVVWFGTNIHISIDRPSISTTTALTLREQGCTSSSCVYVWTTTVF